MIATAPKGGFSPVSGSVALARRCRSATRRARRSARAACVRPRGGLRSARSTRPRSARPRSTQRRGLGPARSTSGSGRARGARRRSRRRHRRRQRRRMPVRAARRRRLADLGAREHQPGRVRERANLDTDPALELLCSRLDGTLVAIDQDGAYAWTPASMPDAGAGLMPERATPQRRAAPERCRATWAATRAEDSPSRGSGVRLPRGTRGPTRGRRDGMGAPRDHAAPASTTESSSAEELRASSDAEVAHGAGRIGSPPENASASCARGRFVPNAA